MNYKHITAIAIIAALANTALATDSKFTVDQADSPNSNKFFDQTQDQIAIVKQDFKEPWDPTDTKAINAFEQEKSGANTYEDKYGNTNSAKTNVKAPVIATPGQTFEKGQRINIRERYKLAGTPSGTDAANALQAQMASFCPKGFAKHGEWVRPVESTKDFYMYYQFECIE